MKKKVDLNKFKDVVGQLKTKQKQLQHLVSKDTLKEAKKYAETSSKELKNMLKNNTDVKKVKSFIEKEAKEIHKLQKAIPTELAKFSKFVETQKKEFEKILKSVHALDAAEFIQEKVGLRKKPSKGSSKKSSKKATEAKATPVKAAEATEAHGDSAETDSSSNQS
jgi:hypothetical protein